MPDPWFDVAKTFLATFTGAALAFGSNIYVQRLQRRRESLTAGNVATLIASQQWSDYVAVRNGFVGESAARLGKKPSAPFWLHFKPLAYPFSEALRFNLASLAFLAETKHFAVLQKLMVVEIRYRDLQLLVERFNEAAAQLQKEMLAIGVRDGVPFEVGEVERRLPVDLVATNESFARALSLRFEEDERDYRDALESLYAALVDRFGPKGVVKGEPLTGVAR